MLAPQLLSQTLRRTARSATVRDLLEALWELQDLHRELINQAERLALNLEADGQASPLED